MGRRLHGVGEYRLVNPRGWLSKLISPSFDNAQLQQSGWGRIQLHQLNHKIANRELVQSYPSFDNARLQQSGWRRIQLQQLNNKIVNCELVQSYLSFDNA